MTNPFKNIPLKDWPDYWLAVTGISFIIILSGLAAGKEFPGGTVAWIILFGGLLLFGIGAKKSYYKAHIKGVEVNINVWVSKWRHGFLSNTFAVIGVCMVLFSLSIFLGYYEPNK